MFSVRADARHILADGSPQPDAGGAAAAGLSGSSSTGPAVDGDAAEGGGAQEALLHPAEGQHAIAHRVHVQLGGYSGYCSQE